MCKQYADDLEDFDLPAMQEDFARAHLVAGNRQEAMQRLTETIPADGWDVPLQGYASPEGLELFNRGR